MAYNLTIIPPGHKDTIESHTPCQSNAAHWVLLQWPGVPEIIFGTYWLRQYNATYYLHSGHVHCHSSLMSV